MNNEKPIIYLITEGKLNSQNFYEESAKLIELIEVAVSSGVSMIQLREKKLCSKLLFQITSQAVKLTQNTNTKILVNDRADVALAAKADGVNLTSNSISAKVIRQNFPSPFLIGVSTHKVEEIKKAKENGADFAVFSPIFYTPNKGEPKGLKILSEAVKLSEDFPLIALGGVNEENFAEVLKTGAKGIAAIRMFNDKKKLPNIMKKVFGETNE